MQVLKPVFLVVLFGLAGCREDPDQAANKLLVESTVAWDQYQALTEGADAGQNAARLKMLHEIDAKLEKIVSNYPGSALAVDLVSTGMAGKLSKEEVEAQSALLTEKIECLAVPDAWKGSWLQSTLALALETANTTVEPQARFEALAEVAKVQASVGDIAGARKTVATALEMAEANKDVGSGTYALSLFAEAQAAAGDSVGALVTAETIEDVFYHDIALAKVAKIQSAIGDSAGARATLAKALGAVKIFQEKGVWTPALIEIARAQLAVNDISGARETLATALKAAKTLPDGDSRDFAMTRISEAQASAGDIAGAIATAKTVESVKLRAKALAVVAKAQAVAGDITGALETERAIEDVVSRALVLANVAKAKAANGDIAGAREAVAAVIESVKTVELGDDLIWVAQAVAGAQVAAGDSSEAIVTANIVRNSSFRAPILAEIAKAQAAEGDCVGASETMTLAIDSIEKSEVSFFRVSTLIEIVQALIPVN